MVNKYKKTKKSFKQKHAEDIKIFLKKKKKKSLRHYIFLKKEKIKSISIIIIEIKIFLKKKNKVEYMMNYYLTHKK